MRQEEFTGLKDAYRVVHAEAGVPAVQLWLSQKEMMAGFSCCWVLGVLAHQTRREAAGRRAAIGVPVWCCLYTFGADLPSRVKLPRGCKAGTFWGRKRGRRGRKRMNLRYNLLGFF